jgi:hypothetical protein
MKAIRNYMETWKSYVAVYLSRKLHVKIFPVNLHKQISKGLLKLKVESSSVSLRILIAALIAVPLFFSLNISDKRNTEQVILKNSRTGNNAGIFSKSERSSITFILGEDKKDSKPYYSLAFDYYKTDKSVRTEYLINSCRSLSEVRDYLRDNPPGNGLPWGHINLVSHGNEWYGMSVPVTPDSKRSSAERIAEFVNAGKFEALSDSLADDSTEIVLHGCGLGNDKSLLKIVAKAFGGNGMRPTVSASKLKEYYSSVSNADEVLKSQLFYARTWSVYYKMKEKPDDEILKQEFIKLFPAEKIDWSAALSRTNPVTPGDVFHYTINVPVYYMKQYVSVDSLPDLSSEAKKIKWISSQKILKDIITKSRIPVDKFKWTTQKIYVADEKNKNKKMPAISVSGWCTVLCVVKPLITEKNSATCDATPFIPAISDTAYFGKSN